MDTSYDLHWKSRPMGAIQPYADGHKPDLGTGVYVLVLATTGGKYVGYYVGQSGNNIGERWRHHLDHWFCHPLDGYPIPKNVDAFLEDPVAVFNGKGLATCETGPCAQRPNKRAQRHKTMQKILANTWFCWAQLNCPRDRIKDVEYELQECLKKHVGITVDGEIGDAPNRRPPTSVPTIRNHFETEFLVPVLPETIP